MLKDPIFFIKRALFFLLLSVFLMTGCTFTSHKKEFLRTESSFGKKMISKIELSARTSNRDKRYLTVEARKILQQKEVKEDIYQVWYRKTKKGDPLQVLFLPISLPFAIALVWVDPSAPVDVWNDAFGYAKPWQKPSEERKNKRVTGAIETSVSDEFRNNVNVRSGKNSVSLNLKRGVARLYLPEFIKNSYNSRPRNDVTLDISIDEYDYEAGSREGQTSYTVTKQHMSELDIVSTQWYKADEVNEFEILKSLALKGNEKASYLVGINRYEYWQNKSNYDSRVRAEALKYLLNVNSIDDKFMSRNYFNEIMGHIYYSKKEYSKAIFYFEQQQTYYSNKLLGLVYKNKKQHKLAKQYFEKALEFSKSRSEKDFLEGKIDAVNFSIIVNKDKDLTASIRKEKYLKKLGHYIEEKRYKKTFLYFSLLEDLKKNKKVSLPKSITYFKGFAYYNLKDNENASMYLNNYLKVSGKEDKYYGKALDIILAIESSEL